MVSWRVDDTRPICIRGRRVLLDGEGANILLRSANTAAFNSRLWISFHNKNQRSSLTTSRTLTQRHKAKHLSSLPHASQPSSELSTLNLRSCCMATCCKLRSSRLSFSLSSCSIIQSLTFVSFPHFAFCLSASTPSSHDHSSSIATTQPSNSNDAKAPMKP